eukprot:229650_1
MGNIFDPNRVEQMATKDVNKHLVVIGHLMYFGYDYNLANEVAVQSVQTSPDKSIEGILQWFMESSLRSEIQKKQRQEQQKRANLSLRWDEYQQRMRHADSRCFAKQGIDIVDNVELKIPIKIRSYNDQYVDDYNCEIYVAT